MNASTFHATATRQRAARRELLNFDVWWVDAANPGVWGKVKVIRQILRHTLLGGAEIFLSCRNHGAGVGGVKQLVFKHEQTVSLAKVHIVVALGECVLPTTRPCRPALVAPSYSQLWSFTYARYRCEGYAPQFTA